MGRMKQSQITYWCHEIIRSQAEEGGYYIDATMGKAVSYTHLTLPTICSV